MNSVVENVGNALKELDLDHLVNDKNVIQVKTKMSDPEYTKSIISEFSSRLNKIGYKVKWKSYLEFVNSALETGFPDAVNGDIIDMVEVIDLENEYCDYISKCIKFIDNLITIQKYDKVIDFTDYELTENL